MKKHFFKKIILGETMMIRRHKLFANKFCPIEGDINITAIISNFN